MIIILEGPDGAGKTTIANQLLKTAHPSRMLHFSKPANDEEAFNYWQVYMAAIKTAKPIETLIFDRSWISDMVYAPIKRGRVEMKNEMAELLNSLVVSYGGGMIIYCHADVNTLWQRCCARGEKYIANKEELKKIADQYNYVFDNLVTAIPVIRYNTSRKR